MQLFQMARQHPDIFQQADTITGAMVDIGKVLLSGKWTLYFRQLGRSLQNRKKLLLKIQYLFYLCIRILSLDVGNAIVATLMTRLSSLIFSLILHPKSHQISNICKILLLNNIICSAINMTDQGCLGLQGVSPNQAYALVADSSLNYQAYLVKLDFTTTTNSGSPPTYSTSVQIKAFVGWNNLFSRQPFAVGQAIFTPFATNVWFTGYLMQTPPRLTPFPFKAGFLMNMASSEPLPLPIQTCYAFQISQGYETTMAEVFYGRTQKYFIQNSNNIRFSRIRTTQDTYTVVNIYATTISKTSTYGCTSTASGNSFVADCSSLAGATVTSISGYKIQEVYQTGSSSATYLKTIDNTQGFNFIPEVGCFLFELVDTFYNLVTGPSCIETGNGLTTTIGLTPSNCITTTITAPQETINYKLIASLRGASAIFAEVPLFLELRHECYLTSLRPPNKVNLTYTLGDPTLVSNDMKFTLNPTAPSCVVDYYLQENGITINNTNPNFALDIISSPPQVLVKVLSSQDLTVVGMHTLKLYGSLLTSAQNSKLSSVTISVLIVCNPISMYPDTSDYISSSPYTAKEISYTVGDPQLKIPFKEFKTFYDCKQPITYSYQLEPSAPLPATVTVDNSVRQLGGGQLFVQIASRSQVTSPMILVKVTASMQNGQFSTSLFIPISFLIANKGPPTFSKQIPDLTVQINEIGTIQLPSVADPDFEDQYSLFSANFGAAASFITGKFPNFKVSPINNSTEPGTYTATITLTDDNPQPQQSTSSFKIKVLPLPPTLQQINTTVAPIAPKNEKKTPIIKIKDGKKLTAQIQSITQAGLVTIQFSPAILVPGNFLQINQTVLRIQVRPGSRDVDPQDIQIIQWNVTSKIYSF